MSTLDDAMRGGPVSQLPPQVTDNSQPVDKSPAALAEAGGGWSEFRTGYDDDLTVVGTTPGQTADNTAPLSLTKQVTGPGQYMSLLDGLFTLPGPATAIATTGDAVAIDPTPPVGANQVLVTTNPTHAHWATESGGGGGETTTFIANEALSALRVVRLVGSTEDQVRYARPPEVEAEAPLGITATAAASGEAVTVVRSGSITDASWSWTPGAPVLCGANGTLTQTQPALPYIVAVGIASTPTTIQLKISPPIFLAA
jgi:hypothetical protein